ncbi:MAG: MarR family transcriptional regulator [Rhodobacteraceae bacterium]|nr:MarR family transcriptional regulator [Paracoccaceae bacterium]
MASLQPQQSAEPPVRQFDLENFLPYQLAVLAARVSREFSENYHQRFGLSIPEWRVVAHLAQSDKPLSVREIHARVDMDKSKVSRAATRLETAGYVTKRPHPEDKRLVELSLSDRGRAMMAELAPLAEAYEKEVLAALGDQGPAFREALRALLAAPQRH